VARFQSSASKVSVRQFIDSEALGRFELAMETQIALLRVLQEREFESKIRSLKINKYRFKEV
jgi:hypothetical protein